MMPQFLFNLNEKHASPEPRRRSPYSIVLLISLTFVIICICHHLLESGIQDPIHALRSLQSDPHDLHPHKAVAVIKYDDPHRIQLLDCYLKRDLATNDGSLDSVIFFAHPDLSPSDSHALDDLISSSPHYVRYNTSSSSLTKFAPLLPLVAEKSTLYITIPSTTVYIRPHALSNLIKSKLAHPAQHLVIANSITAHRRSDLAHLPSPDPRPLLPSNERTSSWRASTLPTVSDPPMDADIATPVKAPASVQGYRQLLLSRLMADLGPAKNPPRDDKRDDDEDGWTREARTHYAFLASLALGRLDQWVMRSQAIAPRYPVSATTANGLAARPSEDTVAVVWGADLLDAGKRGTTVWEEEVWIDGTAVVARLDVRGEGVEGSYLLERWGDYARDMVCPSSRDEKKELREGGGDERVDLKR